MTRREYLKYNQELHDKQGKVIKPGDTVVINNSFWSVPHIGIVDHFTESGNVAIPYKETWSNGRVYTWWLYRHPSKVILLKRGRTKKYGNKNNSKN